MHYLISLKALAFGKNYTGRKALNFQKTLQHIMLPRTARSMTEQEGIRVYYSGE